MQTDTITPLKPSFNTCLMSLLTGHSTLNHRITTVLIAAPDAALTIC